MKKKTIELTVEQARELLGKDAAMDVLIRANFTDDELKPRVTRWKDLIRISGWYVDDCSNIDDVSFAECIDQSRNLFATKEQAEGVLAMAQLSQLMKRVNGDWKPDWKDDKTLKYTISYEKGKIECSARYGMSVFLAFPTEEIRDQFAKDHEDLIKEFFKIYQ